MLFASNYKLFFIQIGLLILGGFLILRGLKDMHDLIMIDVYREEINHFFEGFFKLLLGSLLLKAVFFLWFRVIGVKLTNTKIFLFKSKKDIQADWIEVEYIKKVRFLPRHTYRIKLISEEKSYLFLNEYESIWSVLGDDSQVGRLIKRRKKELNI